MADIIYHLPIPTRAFKAQVHAFAEDAATKLGLAVGAPIEPVVSTLGGRVVYRDTVGAKAPESIRVKPDRSFTIFIPSVTSLERDRFTIAHELGHLLLHFPLVRTKFPKDGMEATRWVDETVEDQRRAEWEANWFAAAFVMPEVLFKTSYRKHNGDVAKVAREFLVSQNAAEVRARSLGL